MIRRLLCTIGCHIREVDFVGTKKSAFGGKRYAYYCSACRRTFSRSIRRIRGQRD